MLCWNGLIGVFLAASSVAQIAKPTYKFNFEGKNVPGYTAVSAAGIYNDAAGFGFEPGSTPGVTPFFFSIAVPEGNYKVTVTLGDPAEPSVTTVKAELRRLMLAKIQTQPGRFETRSFIVNVRRPWIPGGEEVHFKDRERTSEAWAWDNKLTLEFGNTHPKVRSLIVENVDVPTIYIAGDSTSTDQAKEPYNSWGQMLTAFFKPVIAIANNGESGETLRSFMGENRLAKIVSVIKPGDYLFIQFGHNDQKEKGDGVGPFTTYKADLKHFVEEARSRGATPVLITSMHRRTFDPAGKITNSLDGYPDAVRQLAAEEKVALIDLNDMSKVLYESLGPQASGALFAGDDHTHHSDYGSYELAKCIAQGIASDNLPIAKYLVDGLIPFDPAHPDPYSSFDIPPDPSITSAKPYGN